MIIEWYIGFHAPCLRDINNRISPRHWLGHCEIWGYTEDQTWVFIDPQGEGAKIRVMHRYDDVMDQLEARHAICRLILKMPATDPKFTLPIYGALTCASFSGHLLGHRALLPSTLRRKLLGNGAKVIHEAQGKC